MNQQLAQLNIAKFRLAPEDPVNEDFINNLDLVNDLAEAQPGFVWRLIGESGLDDPRLLVNLSVWESIDSLRAFAYENAVHKKIMQRRKEWFERLEFYQVLWWVKAGHEPSVDEAMSRLAQLEREGPSEQAFTFVTSFEPVS